MKKVLLILLLMTISGTIVSCSEDERKQDANFEWEHLDKVVIREFYGYGSNTRIENARTIEVTNLNNSGSGSLRDALNQSGARIIEVKVSGVINLTSNIYVTNGNFWLKGNATHLKGGMLQLEDSNIIVSNLKISKPPSNYDCLSITAWEGKHIENIVLDHLDLSEASDENLNIRGNGSINNVTLQHCKISNNVYGLLQTGTVSNVSVLYNYFIGNTERNIRCNIKPQNALCFEMINNVFEDFRSGTRVSLGTKFSAVNNIFLPRTDASEVIIKGLPTDPYANPSLTHVYLKGNNIPQGFTLHNFDNQYLKNEPFQPLTVTPKEDYKDWVIANAGLKTT